MMNNYRMSVYPIETTDGIQWNVEFPDVKGVGGAGDTPEEAVLDAKENLEAHLAFLREEGEDVPKTTQNDYSGKFLVRCGSKLHRDMAMLADCYGVSLNSLACQALAYYCGEKAEQHTILTKLASPTILYQSQRSTNGYGN